MKDFNSLHGASCSLHSSGWGDTVAFGAIVEPLYKVVQLLSVCGLEEHLVVSNHPVPLRHGGFKNPNSHKQLRAKGISQSIWNHRIHLLCWSSLVIVRTRVHKVVYARQGTSMNMEYFSYVRRYPPSASGIGRQFRPLLQPGHE